MKLITKDIKRLCASNLKKPEEARRPYLKLFNAFGQGTWLISEINEDGTMFGLCDLGMGCPELGYVALSEMTEMRMGSVPMIERDQYWAPEKTLMQYYEDARVAGGIEV